MKIKGKVVAKYATEQNINFVRIFVQGHRAMMLARTRTFDIIDTSELQVGDYITITIETQRRKHGETTRQDFDR
jgi:hypothetical protein